MAYQTGGGGDTSAFIAALRDFAVANGWTKSGEGLNANGGYLFLEKGVCHMALDWNTKATITMYDADGVAINNVPEAWITATVNQSINTALTVGWGHPGYPSGSFYGPYTTQVRDFTGPLVQWYLFTDATGDYIHAAVNTQVDRWQHFGFGVVDKGPMTHSGAAYVTGSGNIWYRDSNNATPSSGAYTYNHPSMHVAPFSGLNSVLYVPDALPAGFNNYIGSNYTGTARSVTQPSLRTHNVPSLFPQNDVGGTLLDHIIAAHMPSWSGNVPMYGSPAVVWSPTKDRACAVGMFPDVRLINMEGLLPGQEITLATDTWKVFPITRQEAWANSLTLVLTSGQYGVAYKKIV